jgi:hypothetical protein
MPTVAESRVTEIAVAAAMAVFLCIAGFLPVAGVEPRPIFGCALWPDNTWLVKHRVEAA